MRKFKAIYLLLFVLAFSGCNMFEAHPYDGHIKGETGINKKNITIIEEKFEGRKSLKFAFIGDTQRWYDDTEKFVKALNQRDDVDFLVHGGDLTDFGLTREFMWQRDILSKLNVPYVALIGNHDCLANGEDIFTNIYGKVNFSFMAGNVKFVCLNTNALEHDYSRPVPDFTFMKNCENDDNPNFEKTIVVMHARPFSEQFDNNVANLFQYQVNQYPKVQFCLNAHDHNLKINDIFEDGVLYYGVPNIAKKQYLLFTINEDDTYEYELVDF